MLLNELYEWQGVENPRDGPPLNSSYFTGYFERTPVENTWHVVNVFQDSDDLLWWENEAGALWELVWEQALIEPEPPVTGCTDHHANNYNPSAEVDDGSCIYPEPEPPVSGCTDTNATNYNPSAEVDDGSCISRA